MFESYTPTPELGTPPNYPNRFPIPEAYKSWDVLYQEYNPPYYTDPLVLTEGIEQHWADPENFSEVEQRVWSEHYDVRQDSNGVPLNPFGRMGIAGRGLLGKWGANYAVDIVVSRDTPEGKEYLLINRSDNHEYAFVGGMVDAGESNVTAAEREFVEEATTTLSLADAPIVYSGYSTDFRTTDNAWIETTVFHIDVTGQDIHPKADDDAEAIQWVPQSKIAELTMHANHKVLLEKVIATNSI